MIPGRFRQESRQYCVRLIYGRGCHLADNLSMLSILFSYIPHEFPCPAYFFENVDAHHELQNLAT